MFAHWHALAKLRLHTDLTLGILDQYTTLLGKFLRDFHSKTSSAFDTKELPREADARERRKTKKKGKKKASTNNDLSNAETTENPGPASSAQGISNLIS